MSKYCRYISAKFCRYDTSATSSYRPLYSDMPMHRSSPGREYTECALLDSGSASIVLTFSGHTGSRMMMDVPVTVNTEWYIELLRRKFVPALRWKRGLDMDTDVSAGWSNTTFLQCFTQISPSLLSWRMAHLPSYGPSLANTCSRPSPLDYLLWGHLKDRVYPNNQ